MSILNLKRTRLVIIALVVLAFAIAAGWLFKEGRPVAVAEHDVKGGGTLAATDGLPSMTKSAAGEDRVGVGIKGPDAGGSLNISATTRELFVDKAVPAAARFSKLARRAVEGDRDAFFYAQTLVSYCHATTSVAKSGYSFGQDSAYRDHLLEAKLQSCRKIAEDLNYSQIKQFADSHPSNSLIGDVARAIKLAFAQRGAEAALRAGLNAIKDRPDIHTVGLVAETFETLDISSYYATTVLRSSGSIPGARMAHDELMTNALTLFACESGMRCDSDSIVVSNYCVVMGQCMPGADLGQLAREQLLSGQDWADVVTLLNFFRQVLASSAEA